MTSAIVFWTDERTGNGPRDPATAFTRSLSALVGPAVAGAIRDMTITGPPGQGLGIIADHAGCGFIEAAAETAWLRDALALAKGPDCLLLCAGYVPGPGFIEELRDLATYSRGVFRAAPASWHQRLLPGLAPVAAAIAPLDLWRAQDPAEFRIMAGQLKAKTLRTAMHRVG